MLECALLFSDFSHFEAEKCLIQQKNVPSKSERNGRSEKAAATRFPLLSHTVVKDKARLSPEEWYAGADEP